MYPFSQIALQRLYAAGWTPERCVDISGYERKAQESGYQLFPCVREFLTRFGSLDFVHEWIREVDPALRLFGWTLRPASKSVERKVWLSTVPLLREPDRADDEYILDLMEGYALQLVAESPTNPGWSVEMNESGAVFRTYEIGDMEHIGISGADGLEAVLTARPPIIKPGDQEAWRKKSCADSWRDYVERTGVVPPEDVTGLLIPEAQEAIRAVAARRRTERLAALRDDVRMAMSPLKVGPHYTNLPLEDWLTVLKQGLNEIRHDIDTFQSRQPIPTADEHASVRTCALLCAVALFAYGDFEAAKDIVENVHSTPTQRMRSLAYVVPLLLPAISRVDPISSSDNLREWLLSQGVDWVWNEELACYESAGSETNG